MVGAGKYAKQLARDDDHVLGFVGGDGRPFLVPFEAQVVDNRITVGRSDLPAGGRRAMVMGFWGNRELHGQSMLTARGWLEVTDAAATFAPSALRKFNLSMGAFGQKVLTPIALGFLYRKAVKAGAVRDGVFSRPG